MATALKANTVYELPLSEIVKGDNIRDLKKTQDVANIEESIRTIGLQEPLIINKNRVLVDGNRRFYTLTKLGITTAQVLVKDIPESEIPLYQYTTMLRTGIGDTERAKAILSYVTKNPHIPDIEVAKKFSVDPATVNSAVKIFKVNETLSKLVLDNQLTQNAALKICESAGIKGTKKPTEKAKKQVELITNTIQNEIESQFVTDDNLKEEETSTVKKPVAWDVRRVNKCLASLNQSTLKVEEVVKEPKQTPVKRQAFNYINQLLETLKFTPDPSVENQLMINGSISVELWKEITSFVAANHESTNSNREERDIDDLYSYYESNNLNGEVFIQDDIRTYITFNAELASLYPSLKLVATVENGTELIRVESKQLEVVISKLNAKGISTLVVKQTKFTVTSTKKISSKETKQPVTETVDTTVEQELQGIPVIEEESSVNTVETTSETVLPELQNTGEPPLLMTEEEADARLSLYGNDDPSLQNAQVLTLIPEETIKASVTDISSAKKGKKAKSKTNPDLSAFLSDTSLVSATVDEQPNLYDESDEVAF